MRRPKPFFRKYTGTWYVQIGKQQVNLGPNEAAAWDRYHSIMAGETTDSESVAVVLLFDRFLEWCQKNRAAASYEFYKRPLEQFARRIGRKLQVRQLKPYHVSQWTAQQYKNSSPTTVHHAIRSVQRALNWAVREGYISASPVAHILKPTRTRREIALTPEQWQKVYSSSDDSFRDLLTILRETGCRPQEARVVEGLRLAFDKPTIIVKDDVTDYSFDTAPIEHIGYPRDLRFPRMIEFKKALAAKITATHHAASTDKNYSTFLKHFGKFTIAKLDATEVSKEDYIIEELKEIRQLLSRRETADRRETKSRSTAPHSSKAFLIPEEIKTSLLQYFNSSMNEKGSVPVVELEDLLMKELLAHPELHSLSLDSDDKRQIINELIMKHFL